MCIFKGITYALPWSAVLLVFPVSVAQAQPGGGGEVPSIFEIVLSDIFVWVFLGAVLGFVLNATHPEYEGIRAVFKRYGKVNVPLYITVPLDLLFFLLLGPIIVTAAYVPAAVFQGMTLGLGWPLVIRGAVANIDR